MITVSLLALGMMLPISTFAAEWENDFEAGETTWKLLHKSNRVNVLSHARATDSSHAGKGSEALKFESSGTTTNVFIEHKLPPATVIDELTCSLWVNASRSGAILYLCVVFPHQIDPQTSKPVEILLRGEASAYTAEESWQKLDCTTDKKSIQQHIIRLRSRFPADDLRDAYVDRMLLSIPLEPGTVKLAIDEARLGPIVSPRSIRSDNNTSDEETVPRHVNLRLGQLQVDGNPFFPIIVPYHGEDPDRLREMGVNVVWIPDYQDRELLKRLRERGIWATAVPPQPGSDGGNRLAPRSASLVPFSRETEQIVFWMMGTKISAETDYDLKSWTEQIRAADRRFDRPLMADVQDSEYIHSRYISLLGSSRPTMHTAFSIHAYRRWLQESQLLAIPGSFVWTWINTEPSSALFPSTDPTNPHPAQLEPEQIRLQVFTALAAGCRGISYWSTAPLDDESPQGRERRLTVTLINQELELLAPILATSSLVAQIPFSVDGELPPQRTAAKVLSFQGRKKFDPDAPTSPLQPKKTDARQQPTTNKRTALKTRDPDTIYEAALFRSPYGRLLLPICYQKDAQFVPGATTARNIRILVSDVEETASAWEVTPTEIRYVPKVRVAGGVELQLERLDVATAIVLTSDLNMISQLKSRLQKHKDGHARATFEVAQSKLQRTRVVNRELDQLSAGLPEAVALIKKAESYLSTCERELNRHESASAYRNAADAMQYLRILQRAHWEAAVGRWPAPGSSQHTFCFQTLPDHWQMLERIARQNSTPTENRLPSGNFEDFDQMIVDGWRHEQSVMTPVLSSAELSSVAKEGTYSLRLVSMIPPDRDTPAVLRRQQIQVHSPPVAVKSGELVQITGLIRVRAPLCANLDG
ncbi:MAG: hypothetical protein ACKVT0_16730, partial [Planctomycetaceae bacterium]